MGDLDPGLMLPSHGACFWESQVHLWASVSLRVKGEGRSKDPSASSL